MRTTTPIAVTFDFWDTLVHAPHDVARRVLRHDGIAAALSVAGVVVTDGHLDEAVDEIRRAFDRNWSANRQFRAEDAVDVLLAHLGNGAERIGPTHRSTLVRIVRGDARIVPSLTPNVATTLRRLKAAGLRLGIVSDVGFAPSSVLRRHLRHHGVLDLFDHWSFSDEVGAYKPHAAIFGHALGGLGVDDPARAVHVGDLRRTDVAGARAFGMTTVRYTGSNDDPGVPDAREVERLGPSLLAASDHIEADHVVADHAELPALLGLGI